MAADTTQRVQQLRSDFEKLLRFVTGPGAQRATLDQMERSLFRQVLRLGFNLLGLFLHSRVENEVHTPLARRGQARLAYHSQKPLAYFSIFGKLTYARAYFYESGQGGCYPLDKALSVPEHCYSDLLLESAELLATDHAYDQSLHVLQHLLDLSLPEAALEMNIAAHSQWVQTFYQRQAPFPPAEEGAILVAQADGKGVPMVRPADVAAPTRIKARRAKGDKKAHKKEAIAIAVYTIDPFVRTPQMVVDALFQHTHTPVWRPAPCHKQVFASLDGKTAAIQRLARWTKRRECPSIQARVALCDGSIPLQQQLRRRLKRFTLILDIIHVDEYLWKAGTAIYGETDARRAPWVATQLLDILSSRSATVIQRLTDLAKPLPTSSAAYKVLRQVRHYLQRNRPFMNYAEYLRQGWPIGTGVIEGVCRHLVKDRMELSGMRWTVAGASALLALRAVNENGDWDAYHAFRREQRHKQLYNTALKTNMLNEVELLEIN